MARLSGMGFTLLFLQLAALCFAQDSSSAARASASISTDPKPSPTSASAAQTHIISVGNGDHKFRPDVTQAEVGDIIEFTFYPTNHSVVRAEYQFPCIPYEMTGTGKTGFFSGFHVLDAVLSDPPNYQLRINDTSPIFFYCSAPGSCITYGMIGVINPNSTATLAAQRSLALNSSYMLNPGEPFPAEGTTPSSAPDPNSTSASDPPPSSSTKKLSAGAIAGISIGALSVIILSALLFFFIGRSKSLRDEMVRKESTIKRTSPPSAFYPHGGGHFSPTTHMDSASASINTSAVQSPPYYAHNTDAPKYSSLDSGHNPQEGFGDRHAFIPHTFTTLQPTTTTDAYYAHAHVPDSADTYKHVSPQGSHTTSPNPSTSNTSWYGFGGPESVGRRGRVEKWGGPVEIGGTEVSRAL